MQATRHRDQLRNVENHRDSGCSWVAVPADRDNLTRQVEALNRAFAARGPELRDAIVRLFRALDPVIEAYRRTAEQLVNSDGFKQLVAFANSPQGQALIAAAEAGELRRPDPCWCLCGAPTVTGWASATASRSAP
jgi:hypothetical protein